MNKVSLIKTNESNINDDEHREKSDLEDWIECQRRFGSHEGSAVESSAVSIRERV